MGHPSRILVRGWSGSGCYGLCDVGTQGWGQGLGWFHSSHGGSWCLTSVGLCWWLYESIWGTSRLTTCIPMAKVGPTAEPATVTHLLPTQWVTRATTECNSWWTDPVESFSAAPLPTEALQSGLPNTAAQKWTWRLLLQYLWIKALCNSMKLWAMPGRATQDGRIMMACSNK